MTDGMKWLEVRPYVERRVKPANMEPVINYAYRNGEKFEVAVACTRNPNEPMEKRVRYFFIASNMETQKVLKSHLENQGFFVTVKDQPNFEEEYPCEVEVEATDDYAERFFKVPSLPITREDVDERGYKADHPDIAGSLAGAITSGGAIRIAFRTDPRATDHIIKYARNVEREGRGHISPVEAILTRFGDIVFNGPTAEHGSREVPPEYRGRADAIRGRANSGMLATDIRVYGTSSEIANIIHSLPTSGNGFDVRRKWGSRGQSLVQSLVKQGEDMSRDDKEAMILDPDRHWAKSHLLRTVAVYLPILLLPVLLFFNLWRPWVAPPISLYVLVPPIIAIFVSGGISYVWREKKHIVLSLPELVFLSSIPTRIKSVRVMQSPESPPLREEVSESGR